MRGRAAPNRDRTRRPAVMWARCLHPVENFAGHVRAGARARACLSQNSPTPWLEMIHFAVGRATLLR